MASVPNGSYPSLDELDQAASDSTASAAEGQAAPDDSTAAPADDNSTTAPQSDQLDQATSDESAAAPASDELDDTEQNTVIQSLGPVITYASQGIPVIAQTGIYVNITDTLNVHALNSLSGATLRIDWKQLLPDQSVTVGSMTYELPSDRSLFAADIPLAEGYFLGCHAEIAQGDVIRGQCWVSLGLKRGTGPNAYRQIELCSGYILTNYAVAWPGGKTSDSTEGKGYIAFYEPGPFPAGEDLSFTVPTNTRWRPKGLIAALTTSAGGGNRTVVLVYQFTDNSLAFDIAAGNVQAPGTALGYSCQAWGTIPPASGGAQFLPIPTDFELLAGWSVATITEGIQPGDVWSNVKFTVEEWFD